MAQPARRVDDDFRGLPLDAVTDAALSAARGAGAEHADVRVQRAREARLALRDGRPASTARDESFGVAVRVVVDGVLGFAATDDVTPEGAVRACAAAVEVAAMSAPLVRERVVPVAAPVHVAEWVSDYAVDPFTVPEADQVALLAEWSRQLLAAPGVDHVDAGVLVAKEQKHYADLSGTRTLQQRVLLHPELTAVAVTGEGMESLRTLAPPSARGWEYLEGAGWDWAGELGELPDLLAERVAAPSVEPGVLDLVIDPTNLWLTIHESVGHATELDRALGYEAAYAGTSFVTPDAVGSLRYGSALMTVTGDRVVPHGCATIGFDDDGVATGTWDLVRDGVLVGLQTDRLTAARAGLPASNGCAYADSAFTVPVQRMPNVSLLPADAGRGSAATTTADLIAAVDDGLYVVGDKSWSIDMQRYNFQFTAQRFHRIRGGRLVGQVKDAAYQGSTPSFWASLIGLGGPSTYHLGGAPNCGKAQPGQTAWVSHGSPATLFTGVRVLNTREEGGR